jgi:hypothetical protein
MGGKFSHKLKVFLPWMLLNRNFLKENRYYPHAGWENSCAKIFPKLLLGQCRECGLGPLYMLCGPGPMGIVGLSLYVGCVGLRRYVGCPSLGLCRQCQVLAWAYM